MKVFSASRREDMPAFHFNELKERIRKEGEDAFWVLWTKNPRKLIDSGLDFRRIALQLTVTGLGGTKWEPNVPTPKEVWNDVAALIKQGFNPDLINWRLDPVIKEIAEDIRMGANKLSSNHGMTYGMAAAAARLGISRCVTSFVTFYGIVKERWPEYKESEFSDEQQVEIIKALKGILAVHGIKLYGCAQPNLAGLIEPSSCIDGTYYSNVTNFDLAEKRDKHQRKYCNCTVSVDIGKYRKCAHGCVYCYSQSNQESRDIDMDDF